MGGKIDNLKPGYNAEMEKINSDKRLMIAKLLKMVADLNTMEEKDLVGMKTDVLIELGKDVKKGWENWDSIKHPEKYVKP